jgi:hypothetical protein
MPDPGVPPPLPPLATVVNIQPIPVQPLPVQPLPARPPQYQYNPDDYGTVRRRPGIITAIAIISITVGSLGLFGGGLSALYGGLFYAMARVTNAMTTASTQPWMMAQPQPSPNDATTDASGEPIVTDRGLETSARQSIINVLSTLRPLTDARKQELHFLLAKAGQDMFPSSGGAVDSSTIRTTISASGQLPNPSDTDPAPGPDFFVISGGQIEVSDKRAIFQPSDHSLETIRVSAVPPKDDDDGSSAPTTSPDSAAPSASPPASLSNSLPVPLNSPSTNAVTALSRQDVQAAMLIVNSQSQHRLTSPQRQAIRTEFASGSGLLLPPASGIPIRTQLSTCIVQPDGSVLILTMHGQLQVGNTGIIQTKIIYPNAGPMIFGTGPKSISLAAVTLVITEGIISVLLSIYLLIIGILTLRQTPRARRLHIIYALLKIPLAITCGIGWCWLIGGFFNWMPNNGAAAPVTGIRAMLLCFVTVAAIIYPIGLLIAFATPKVKSYYDTASSM